MPIVIGPGIEIGPGITAERGAVIAANLVYDLDAANYAAMPANGTVVAGTGTTGQRTLTVANAGASISWQAANGGVFRKSNTVGTDVMYGGPIGVPVKAIVYSWPTNCQSQVLADC